MPNEPKNYDLIIIGGGPAGIVAANTATANHKKVALIDSHHELGGAGINTGTVPSKTLRETALALSGLQSRDLYGVDLSVRREVTIRDFLGHEQHVKSVFNESFLKRLRNEHSDIYFGAGLVCRRAHGQRQAAARLARRENRDIRARHAARRKNSHRDRLVAGAPAALSVRQGRNLRLRLDPDAAQDPEVDGGHRRGRDRQRIRLHLRGARRAGAYHRRPRQAAAVPRRRGFAGAAGGDGTRRRDVPLEGEWCRSASAPNGRRR